MSKGHFAGSFIGFLPQLITERRFGLDMLTPLVFGNWGFHLWFLGFLFAYSLLALPIFVWLKQEKGQWFIVWLSKVINKRGGIFLFIIPLVLSRYLLQPFFPTEHDWADFIYTFIFFIAGYILYSDDRFLAAIQRDRWLLLAGGLLGAVLLLGLFATGSALNWVAAFVVPWSNVLWFVFSVTSWCTAVFLLAFGQRHLNFSNKWLVCGNRTIMPIYLLHQPVIILIAFYVVQWEADILVKLPLVVLSSFLVTVSLVELAVQRFKPIQVFMGMKPR